MSRYFKAQPGPVGKNTTLGHSAEEKKYKIKKYIYLDTRDFPPPELSITIKSQWRSQGEGSGRSNLSHTYSELEFPIE